jgi:hypothetical protein
MDPRPSHLTANPGVIGGQYSYFPSKEGPWSDILTKGVEYERI